MVKNSFSTTWKRSKQTRKQRKYRYNAPLHLKQKFLRVHLSAGLRKKHGLRSIQVRKGDKIKVMRGQYKKKEGKVERVSLKYEKVFVTGIELIKKDGTRSLVALSPSNLVIVELNIDDKKRKGKLEAKKKAAKEEDKGKVELEKKEETKK